METTFLLAVILILISAIPIAFCLGKGYGHADGYQQAKSTFKNEKPLTDGKVNELAKNICNSYNMN